MHWCIRIWRPEYKEIERGIIEMEKYQRCEQSAHCLQYRLLEQDKRCDEDKDLGCDLNVPQKQPAKHGDLRRVPLTLNHWVMPMQQPSEPRQCAGYECKTLSNNRTHIAIYVNSSAFVFEMDKFLLRCRGLDRRISFCQTHPFSIVENCTVMFKARGFR